MEERRKEERTLYDSIPESIKVLQIKAGILKSYSVNTVDISFSGMGFITSDKVDNDLDIGKQVDICFSRQNCNLKANVVYIYPVKDSKTRVGIIFKQENSIKQYNKILKKCSEMGA